MKDLLQELLDRLSLPLKAGQHSCLRLGPINPVEDIAVLRAPVGTAVILGNYEDKTDPLAVLAIAPPDLSPDTSGLLSFTVRRAQAHKTPYFVTWTLREAVLWETPKLGTPMERQSLKVLRSYEHNYQVAQTTDASLISEALRCNILDHAQLLLHDLEKLYKYQALELVDIDATFFVGRLLATVEELLPLMAESLHFRVQSDHEFCSKVITWANAQGIPGSHNDPHFSESVARQIIYRLLGKILFYQSLRRVARKLPALNLDGVESSEVMTVVRRVFAEALKIDYHAVFAETFADSITWPSEAAKRLTSLVHDLNTRDFSHLPQDVVGTVFERLIPPEERHRLGQYFTNENLCDLVIAFCVRLATDRVLDPTCGTGTFDIRAYDRLCWLGERDHPTLLNNIWGVDIAPFPAELAVINLFRQNLSSSANFPRIACMDFFHLSPGDKLPFPPPKMDIEHPALVNEPVPLFDALVGNFPYVSQDHVDKTEVNYREFLRRRLIDDWFEDYPQLFHYQNKKDHANFEKAIAIGKHGACDRTAAQLSISTFADLYVYLFFHAAKFLTQGGRMGIVTSNAWLDVNYGFALQRFFCDRFKIIAILDSRCEPWFTEASVNTIVTIVERCDNAIERDRHLVKFVKVEKPLSELIPGDPKVDGEVRWKRLTSLVEQIETAGRPFAQKQPFGVETLENDLVRIRVCRQGELRAQLEHNRKATKWGKYLHAPPVFFDLARQQKLTPLANCAVVEFGGKSGVNEFYYLDTAALEKHSIEKEFLRPLLKSPGDSNHIPIKVQDLETQVFVCRMSKSELASKGKTGALAYIQWGEQQTFSTGKLRGTSWPNGIEVRDRKPGWYALPEYRSKPAHVFLSKAFHDRHMQRFSPEPLIADQRLYFLSPAKGFTSDLLAALLNSSVTALMIEIFGRVTLGDGVLELAVEDANDYLLVPDLRKASQSQKKAITDAFEKICKRDIGNVFEEVKQKDRQELDSAVLRAVGLDPKMYLQPIHDGVCALVRERVELGKKRSQARKTKSRKASADKAVFQEVLVEIFPHGAKRFPDDFFTDAVAKDPRKEVAIPNKELVLDASGFVPGLYARDKTWNYHLENAAEGKFILYAQASGQKVAALPKKPVEVLKAVGAYENYLREQRKNLHDAFHRRTLDITIADRLTQAAWERLSLPPVPE